jgi:hypothetical protein
MKLYIYLYQIYEENIIYNSQLKDSIFYDGTLCSSYDLNEHEAIDFNVKVFPLINEEVSTTCLIVDEHSEIIYMSPVSKVLLLK